VRGWIVESTVCLGLFDAHARHLTLMPYDHGCTEKFASDDVWRPLEEFPRQHDS
jgi:hypothetical protein